MARCRTHLSAWALAASLSATMLAPAHAATYEALGGVSKTSGWRWTEAVFATVVGDPRPFDAGRRALTWSLDAGLGWVGPRSASPQNVRENMTHPVWMAMGGVRLSGFWRQAFFGFGVALTKDRTGTLSSPYEFVSTFGWQGDRYVLAIRHISDASLHEPNLGETMVLAGVRF